VITNGKFGNARFFSTSTSTVYIGTASSCNFTTNDFSIEAWVRLTANFSAAYHCIIARYSGWPMWYSYIASAQVGARLRAAPDPSPNYQAASGAIATGVWTHVVVTYDRDGNMTRYVNGAVWDTPTDISAISSSNLVTGNLLHIGASGTLASPSYGFQDGEIDDAKVYGDLLSTDEITDLYNNQGYSTTNYPGRVLIRKYATPDPSVSLGPETTLDRGSIFSTR